MVIVPLFVNFGDYLPRSKVLFISMCEDEQFFSRAAALDLQSRYYLSKTVQSRDFQGKKDQVLQITIPDGILETCPDLNLIVLVGVGKKSEFDTLAAQKLGAEIVKISSSLKLSEVTVLIETTTDQNLFISSAAYGSILASFEFNSYKTKKNNNKSTLNKVAFLTEDVEILKSYFNPMNSRASGVIFARELVTTPPNDLFPASYAKIVQDAFNDIDGCKIEVLNEKEMMKLGMNALLGVGRASARESRLLVLHWNGAKNKEQNHLALVGKGVTFDTGGISLKPSRGMWDMKYDMGGSAAVVGAIMSMVLRKLPLNVVGVLPLVENAISGDAMLPSDIVKSMSGQTIEVLNTDAEGRLILADAMWYAQEIKPRPKFLIDVATLTGAIVVALGEVYAGVFSNDDDLQSNLIMAGKSTNELIWPFPMHEKYDEYMDSQIADMKNISLHTSSPGSITAAQFLKRFVQDGVSWAHLDIAGVAWSDQGKDLSPKGATGFGVSLLDELASILLDNES